MAQHLEKASREGYIAGVKLVRGAYLSSEPRELIWDTKEETDRCYDSLASAVLQRTWTSTVHPPSNPPPPFPEVNIVLATHNLPSVKAAISIRQQQLLTSPPETLPRLAYAQLQGMADEVTQEIVQDEGKKADIRARVVKCMCWGTTGQCLNYLMRRASENKEAAMRTRDTRRAMGAELWRRWKVVFGLV